MSGFNAVHVERTGTFILPAPMGTAFPMFSPDGERAWAPGWDPEYLHPADGAPRPGMVFRTAAAGEDTLWLVTLWDPAAGRAEYVRVVPGSRIGTVSVQCAGSGADETRVEVTYQLTALSEAGNTALRQFTADSFARMMLEWKQLITAALAG